ncbi:hypothetical protein, conserved [Angomonas deanei]|uniref:Ribosomal protein L30p/L7e n=1 Tax=Angomonas deanei TaxID=59799 RepID=A0A7G2CUY3_9TRYP|nr:hypothetical protein, conserved [Angomonas deanei]
MVKQPPKWLPGERVKETVLLQRKSVEQLRADRVGRRDKLEERRAKHKAKIDAKRKKKLTTKKFISAQTILKHAQRKIHQGRTFQKIGEKSDGRRRRSDPEKYSQYLKNSKIVLVVRSKGTQVPPEVAGAFRTLGLQKLYSARLLCTAPHNHKLLKQLAPFSIVGHPDKKQIDELIRTRGALWNAEQKSRRYISGNMMLEKALGEYNIICIEDLVDTINERGEHVEEVLKKVAPFDFHPPRQLFLERHRSVHQKLEMVNQESFAAYLSQQLMKTAKTARREGKEAAAQKKVKTE